MSPKKVLIVDDSDTILALERLRLKPHYDVLIAKSGRNGLVMALAARPDLILLDLVMPDMNGFEVCKALRAEEATRRTPIIMFSSQARPENIQGGYKVGCSAFIHKPIHGPTLLSKIRELLGE